MEFYRLGYYQGLGGRLIHRIEELEPMNQNMRLDPNTMGCDWKPSLEFTIPKNWPPGVYLNKLISESGRESYIPFVVRQEVPAADFVVLLSTNTYHAYNNWGGKSLYSYNSREKVQSHAVSFNRPFKQNNGAGLLFQFEYNLIRWLEKEGYSLTYITDSDLHEHILDRAQCKTLIIAGHSEYWSMEMRQSVEKHTAKDINIGLFNANVAYWQVRMEADQQQRKDRVMVCYKQNAVNNDPIRFKSPKLTTYRWREPLVDMPENRLFGVMYVGIPKKTMPLIVTNADHWLYEGTGLKNGDQIEGVIGGEVDAYDAKLPGVEVKEHKKLAGVEIISHSPVELYGRQRYADVVWYNKPTGGKCFAVGTFYWNWFLDHTNYEDRARENKAIQQITRNALRKLLT